MGRGQMFNYQSVIFDSGKVLGLGAELSEEE
jgi:hypothetical protein